MSRSLQRSVIALGFGLLVASTSVASNIDDQRVRRIGDDQRVAITEQIAQVQRAVRDSLVAASLTTDQMTVAYNQTSTFVRNYTAAVRQGHPSVSEHTFQELYDGKIARALQGRYALSAGETDFIRAQVRQWVDLELAAPDLTGGE